MDRSFDEAYARYLTFLAKLDTTENISEKNVLFRQLTEQLSDLENRLKNRGIAFEREEPACDDSEPTYWI
ncbi:MAG: hypothetical protein A2075_23715 [Geobacteraceae bacterium GWC2_58_44]|nr:MAG: hypothetical protein A2075_23715 [Geobacteraceae bacterium GWC2_58_44]HBG07183.1 hypothetical protein [Geobacter sp.]